MEKKIEAVRTLVRPVVTIVFLFLMCYMEVTGREASSTFNQLALICFGSWFGDKTMMGASKAVASYKNKVKKDG